MEQTTYARRRRTLFFGTPETVILYTQFLAGPVAETDATENGDGPEVGSFIGLPVRFDQLLSYGCYESPVQKNGPISNAQLSTISTKHHTPNVFRRVKDIVEQNLKCINLSFLGDYLKYDPVIDHWITIARKMENGFAAIDIAPVLHFRFDSLFPGASSTKSTLVIDAGIHDREWTAIETVLVFASNLASLVKLAENGDQDALHRLEPLQNTEFVIVPVVDIYGFIKTTMVYNSYNGPIFSERLNRSQTYMGADPNRSFPFCWGMKDGSNTDPLGGDSSGMFPLSLPCSRAMYSLFSRFESTGALVLDIHAYGNVIIPEPSPTNEFIGKYSVHKHSKKKEYTVDMSLRAIANGNYDNCTLSAKFMKLLLDSLQPYKFTYVNREVIPYDACGTITQTAYHHFAYMAACIEVGNMRDQFNLTDENLVHAKNVAKGLFECLANQYTIDLCKLWVKNKPLDKIKKILKNDHHYLN